MRRHRTRDLVSRGVLLAVLFLFSDFAIGRTYYVSATQGNDTNDGSAASPWQTIARVNREAFQPGDSVLFQRGDQWRETLRPASSGSDLAPLTFGAYGRGPRPVIAGSDLIRESAWQSGTRGLYFLAGLASKPASVWQAGKRLKEVASERLLSPGSKWCWAAGLLYVRSDREPPTDTEVQVRDANIDNKEQSHVVYQELSLRHAREGLRLYTWSAAVRDVTLQDSWIETEPSQDHGTMSAGVYASVHSGRISGVTIRRNTFIPYPAGLRHWGVYFVQGVSDFRIEDNSFGPAGEDAICVWHSSRGVIARNRGGGNGENTIDVKDSHDIRVAENLAENDLEYNIVIHGVDRGSPTEHISVVGNRCVGGGRGGHLTAGIALLFVRRVRVEDNRIEDPYREGIFVRDADGFSANEISENVILLPAGNRKTDHSHSPSRCLGHASLGKLAGCPPLRR
jgi:hypothetical protein